MLVIGINNRKKKTTKGFTLIELIVVIAIIGVLSSVAVLAYTGYVKKAKEEVCRVNCLQVERLYEIYLESKGLEGSDGVLEEFMQKNGKGICPEHGVVTYVDGKVKCSVHTIEDEELPFL